MSPALQLYATPLSHFSRKVRLLLDHYGAPYEVHDIGNVAEMRAFGDNPLMKVPVLKDGPVTLFESDHIAAYLARKLDPSDRYHVLTGDPEALNMRAVLNGIMGEEVKLVLATRTGLDTMPHVFFHKVRKSIAASLEWLEARADAFNTETPGYMEFHFISMWEHLAYFDMVPMPCPKLHAMAEAQGKHVLIAKTAPGILKPKAD